jgi:hypothetical protein
LVRANTPLNRAGETDLPGPGLPMPPRSG